MGIEEDTTMNIRIFPTPAHDYCNLTLPHGFNHQICNVKITAASGAPVMITLLTEENNLLLDVHSLVAGIYFVTLSGMGNSGYYHGKFVKN
jgi:hypothetical protein